MRTESYGDPAVEELAGARDCDELCRLLVRSPWEWGSSTRHEEAISLLRGLRGGTRVPPATDRRPGPPGPVASAAPGRCSACAGSYGRFQAGHGLGQLLLEFPVIGRVLGVQLGVHLMHQA